MHTILLKKKVTQSRVQVSLVVLSIDSDNWFMQPYGGKEVQSRLLVTTECSRFHSGIVETTKVQTVILKECSELNY